jgi:hypothetical protein
MITGGYKYTIEYQDEEDCSKIDHYLQHPDGHRSWINWSPYSWMEDEEVNLYIALGFPASPNGNRFRSGYLEKMLEERK